MYIPGVHPEILKSVLRVNFEFAVNFSDFFFSFILDFQNK